MSSIPSFPSSSAAAASARKGSSKVSLDTDVVVSNEDDDYENELAATSGPAAVREEEGDYESNATSDTDETGTSDEEDDSEANSDDDDEDDSSSVDAAQVDVGKEKDDGDGDGDDSSDDETQKKPKKKRTAATSSSSKKNPDDDLTLLGVPHGIFGDDDDNDDDSDSDVADRDSSEYFQKLSSAIRESYVETYHPESLSHNYDEIQTLARVIRNADGVIVDDLHRTIPIMTKYERTRILGQRAKQLNEGAPAFIKIDSTVIDGYLIAVKELEQKKTPFIIRRPLPNGGSEYWRVQDLEIL